MAAPILRHPLLGPLLLGAGLIGAAAIPAARKLPQNFGDTDDALRLQNVRDLLGGQNWFDLVQHRMAPPAGLDIHWSRLVDAPQAALIAIARPFAGPENAELFMRAVWPPLLFVVALFALLRVAFRHGGEKAAWAHQSKRVSAFTRRHL